MDIEREIRNEAQGGKRGGNDNAKLCVTVDWDRRLVQEFFRSLNPLILLGGFFADKDLGKKSRNQALLNRSSVTQLGQLSLTLLAIACAAGLVLWALTVFFYLVTVDSHLFLVKCPYSSERYCSQQEYYAFYELELGCVPTVKKCATSPVADIPLLIYASLGQLLYFDLKFSTVVYHNWHPVARVLSSLLTGAIFLLQGFFLPFGRIGDKVAFALMDDTGLYVTFIFVVLLRVAHVFIHRSRFGGGLLEVFSTQGYRIAPYLLIIHSIGSIAYYCSEHGTFVTATLFFAPWHSEYFGYELSRTLLSLTFLLQIFLGYLWGNIHWRLHDKKSQAAIEGVSLPRYIKWTVFSPLYRCLFVEWCTPRGEASHHWHHPAPLKTQSSASNVMASPVSPDSGSVVANPMFSPSASSASSSSRALLGDMNAGGRNSPRPLPIIPDQPGRDSPRRLPSPPPFDSPGYEPLSATSPSPVKSPFKKPVSGYRGPASPISSGAQSPSTSISSYQPKPWGKARPSVKPKPP